MKPSAIVEEEEQRRHEWSKLKKDGAAKDGDIDCKQS
jgi:hypothetical protein